MNVLALIIGGFLGTVLRYELEALIPAIGYFQLSIVIVNLIGCLFFAWFFTAGVKRKVRLELMLGIGTGFTGAFTTFSTFSLHSVDALLAGQMETVLAYILISVAGGLAMAFIGVAVGKVK